MAIFCDVNQRDFRAYNDNAVEASSTAIAALNANWTQAQNANFCLRFDLVKVAGSTWTSTNNVKFQYNLAGAGWNDITNASLVVRLATSAFIPDETATTQRDSSPDTFLAGNILTTSASSGR